METILVIDDELFMRRLCDDMLSLRGFKVLPAESAKEGLTILERGGVDVVLLDIMMPELSGIEFLPTIKKTDPDVFVIIITAYASLETAIEALKKGAYDYIRKPFRPHELYHSVDKAIGRRRAELENKRLLHEMQLKVKELSTLNRVGKYIHSLLEIERVLEKIVLSIAAVMGVEIVSIMLIDRETGELTIRASTGLSPEIVKRTRQKVGSGIAGWVAKRGEPLLVNDIENDPRFAKLSSDVKYRTKSLLSVPLITKSGILGVINVNRKSSGEVFDDHDLELLTTFSSQAAAAIENGELYARVTNFNRELEEKVRVATAELARSNQELERRVAELSTLYEASRVMSSTLNLRELVVRMMEEVRTLIPHDVGEICVWDEDAEELRVLATFQGGQYVPREGRYRLEDGTSTGWIATHRRHLLVPTVGQSEAPGSIAHFHGGGQTASYIGLPLLKGDKLVGTFELGCAAPGTFNEEHLTTMGALAGHLALSVENAHLYSNQQRNFIETLRSLVHTLEARDEYTRNHSERMTRVSVLLAKALGLPEARISAVRIAGALHDIGKIGMEDTILKLTPAQRRVMQMHPEIGARILEPIRFLKGIKEIVLHHQERFNGTGYPRGLKGEAIPLESRILAVADAYDAMMSRRRYRDEDFTHQSALAEVRKGAGKQFDPTVVEALGRLDERGLLALYGNRPEAEGVQVLVVDCSRCGAQFRVDARKIPAGGAKVRCRECQEPLVVRPEGGAAAPAPAGTPA
jgi:predicted Zn finger-like uncharacterized protein/putative nucleotidyltransferase with HDIG domain